MKEEVSNENDEHAEAQDEVTFLLLSRDEDCASVAFRTFFLSFHIIDTPLLSLKNFSIQSY